MARLAHSRLFAGLLYYPCTARRGALAVALPKPQGPGGGGGGRGGGGLGFVGGAALNANLRIAISTSTFTRCFLNIVSAAVGVMKLLHKECLQKVAALSRGTNAKRPGSVSGPRRLLKDR
jgi:hypothetical protein